ncbi:SMI1/KNR4 family protein [Catellatospora coxensis]|nr:SMI1/KNR4 family protein [Catellatospora coxensis]
MLDGLDALQALCGEDRDCRRGWEFVHAQAAAYGRPVVEGDGVDADRLRAAEERLGIALPAALREAYLLFGRRRDLTAAQDRLLTPGQLRCDAEGVLVFRVENQHCASWGVSPESDAHDDPPVLMSTGGRWMPYADRLSIALVEMVLSEAMFSADEETVDNRADLDDAARVALRAMFVRLPLPDLPLWAAPDQSPVRWFAGPDVLLREDSGTWLWVHGRTPAAVQAVRDRLPGDWLMVPEDEGDED